MKNDWRLKSLHVYFREGSQYSDDPEKKKDRYDGTIEFQNGDKEELKFNIPKEKMPIYIGLLSDSIISTANELVEKLKSSLKKTSSINENKD